MNTVKILKGILFFLICFFVGAFLHLGIFQRIPIGVVTPNVLLLITASFGFMEGGIWAMGFGFIAGITLDSFNPDYFGLNCLIFLFVGFLNGLLTRFFYGDDIRLPLVFIGASDVFYGICTYLFLALMGLKGDFGFYFMNIIMPEAVYTTLVFVPLYFAILKGFSIIKKESVRPIT